MREIEILYRVNMEKKEIIEKILKLNPIVKGENTVIDIYYYNENLIKLIPQGLLLPSCFRTRKSSFGNSITYKENIFDENNIWQYCEEDEIKIDNFETANRIIEKLGLKELIKIDNCKSTFIYENYEIVVEEVQKLGMFVEVELKIDDGSDYLIQKDRIRKFVESLNLNNYQELNKGKPEMMLELKLNNFNK